MVQASSIIGQYLYTDKIYDESKKLKIDVKNSTYYIEVMRNESGSLFWNTSEGDFPVASSTVVVTKSNTPWNSLQGGITTAYLANGTVISSGEDRKVIMDAIRMSSGEVKLLGGEYSLSGLTITSPITLRGEGDATVFKHKDENPITIKIMSDNVKLKDFKLAGNNRSSGNSIGVFSDGYHFVIDGLKITNYHHSGIKVKNPKDSVIKDCSIIGIGSDGKGYGIYASNSENELLIRDVFVKDCGKDNYYFVSTNLSSNWCYLCQP